MVRMEVREQERQMIRQLIRTTLRTELIACRDLDTVITDVVARRGPELSAPQDSAAIPAVTFLFGKIWRSFTAARILAHEGFGPDAMVVARCLINATIDLGYIVKENSEERARQWRAVGTKTQRDYGQQFGKTSDGTQHVNWARVEERAKQWEKLGIHKRAKCAGLEDLYQIAYKAGSSPEHSDSWSSIDYLEEMHEGGVNIQVGPSIKGVRRALSAASWGLSAAFPHWCEFLHFDEGAAIRHVLEIGHRFSKGDEQEDPSPARRTSRKI